MTAQVRRVAAALLLGLMVAAGAFGAAPGLLAPHAADAGTLLPGSVAPSAPAPEVPSSAPLPGAPEAPASGLPGAGASSPAPFAPAPAVGLPVASAPGIAAPTQTVGAALVASLGSPHDALLASTGSASAWATAVPQALPAGLAAAAPEEVQPLLAAMERLSTLGLDLARDPQAALREALAAADVPAPAARMGRAQPASPEALEAAVLEVYESLGIRADARIRAQLREDTLGLDPRLAGGLATLLGAVAEAQRTMNRIMGALEPQEYQLLWDCARPTDDAWGNACADPFAAAAIARNKLDRAAMAEAALGMLAAVEAADPLLQEFRADLLAPSQAGVTASQEDDTNLFNDPLFLIEVGGDGNDIYRGNLLLDFDVATAGAADPKAQILTLDFTGNDLYLSRAGGTAPSPLVAAGSGSGGLLVVNPEEERRFVRSLVPHQDGTVGFGALASLTIDYSGDDTYSGAIGYQGAGVLGIGVLLELAGNDRYTATSASQGAGDSGIGVLLDGAGNDVYSSSYRSQGYGTVGGLGLLVDGAGGDSYSGQILLQGAGSNQGVGIFTDQAGDDTYSALSSTGGSTASQGASHLIGVGLFADGIGMDRYSSTAVSRGQVFPAAAPYNTGSAVFLDRGGFDTYSSSPGLNGGQWPGGNAGYGLDRN